MPARQAAKKYKTSGCNYDHGVQDVAGAKDSGFCPSLHLNNIININVWMGLLLSALPANPHVNK